MFNKKLTYEVEVFMGINKEKILNLYFTNGLKQVDIAKLFNISKVAVHKILKTDSRFEEEKERRKDANRIKHNKQIQRKVEEKRKAIKFKNNIDSLVLKEMHKQASIELSGGKKTISNRAYRDWNTSIYKYNEKSKSYVLKKGIIVGADVPSKISWE